MGRKELRCLNRRSELRCHARDFTLSRLRGFRKKAGNSPRGGKEVRDAAQWRLCLCRTLRSLDELTRLSEAASDSAGSLDLFSNFTLTSLLSLDVGLRTCTFEKLFILLKRRATNSRGKRRGRDALL